MNWKKIIGLALLLAVLVLTIVVVEKREKKKQTAEETLFDMPASAVEKIELRNAGGRYVFSRQDTLWHLQEPLATKADKGALESILDNFCPLKYDRLVKENAGELKDFGLDRPEVELKLIAKNRPARTILLGMKNAIDGSSYAKLSDDNRIVTVSAYKRNDLEKDLFAFRDKKILELDTTTVNALEFRRGDKLFSFARNDGRWFLEKPLYSLAQEDKVNDILTAASALESLSFAPAAAGRDAFGLDKPLLTMEFRSSGRATRVAVGQKSERYFALVEGATEICGIDKGFIEKFGADAAAFREKKVASFYPFDVREIALRHGALEFTARKNAADSWEFIPSRAGKKPAREKIEELLTALAELEATEFIDDAKVLPVFPTRVSLKTADPVDSGKWHAIVMEFGAAEGETVIVRNPSLPYQFRIGKEILGKLPAQLGDLCQEGAKAAAPVN